MSSPVLFQRIETASLFIAATLVFLASGFGVGWYLLLLLVFDISMIGYFWNPKIGAWLYNLGHSLIGASVVSLVYFVTAERWALGLACLWIAHIGMDRALGYGLKESSKFTHTHLGDIGKKVDNHPTPNSLLKRSNHIRK